MQPIGMIALAGAALLQGDMLERSWTSTHWAVTGVYGSSPGRLATIVDRDSIVAGPQSSRRTFNMIFMLERRPARSGTISRYWINCDTWRGENMASANYESGRLVPEAPKPPQPLTVTPGDSAIFLTMKAVCTDNWEGMTLLDVPGDQLGARTFAN